VKLLLYPDMTVLSSWDMTVLSRDTTVLIKDMTVLIRDMTVLSSTTIINGRTWARRRFSSLVMVERCSARPSCSFCSSAARESVSDVESDRERESEWVVKTVIERESHLVSERVSADVQWAPIIPRDRRRVGWLTEFL